MTRPGSGALPGVVAAGVCAWLWACACPRPAPMAAGEASMARFTVRGRWESPAGALASDGTWARPEVTWGVADAPGPELLGDDALDAAAGAAAAAWNATGAVRLRRAGPDEVADVTLAWARGEHGDCPAFGPVSGVAHAGPVGTGTFVHLDAGRDWEAGGRPLRRTLAHELGHVLGLDHSDDPEALMAFDPGIDRPGPSDVAGLQSLYGGGMYDPGDLSVLRWWPEGGRVGARVAPSLRRVAPGAVTDFELFDTDGDGDDEVLVWRTDVEGHGRLVIHHFEPTADGPRLAATVGPLLGAVPYGSQTAFLAGDDGRRWVVSRLADGDRRLRRFDERGWLADVSPLEARGAPDEACPHPRRVAGDLDGDGRLETLRRGPLGR